MIYATDRAVYKQGDVVKIGVTNTSDVRVAIVDRIHIDGGFATIEEQAENGQWRAIELYAAANVTVVRALEPGERYQYVCQTARLGWSKS